MSTETMLVDYVAYLRQDEDRKYADPTNAALQSERLRIADDLEPLARKLAGEQMLAFTHATINKMQDVMAVHGFAVPVRVISDAFRTTAAAQRQEQEGGRG